MTVSARLPARIRPTRSGVKRPSSLTLARPAGGSAPRVTISAVSCASATSDAGSATRRSPRSDGWRHSPKVGQTFQTVPTVVFFTRELEPLDRYVEFTAIYHKVG